MNVSKHESPKTHNPRAQLKKLIISAMLVALGVVFSRLLSIPLPSVTGATRMYLGFGPLPIMLLACMYGPLWGGIGAFAWDVIGALLFPSGAFNPVFSITAAIFGVIFGLFFMNDKLRNRVMTTWLLLACAVSLTIYSGICNTIMLVVFYSLPWQSLAFARALELICMIPICTLMLAYIMDFLKKRKLI